MIKGKKWRLVKMKKIFLMLMVVCCVFVTGCFGKDNNSALKDIRKKYENLKAYQLTGNLEILNNYENTNKIKEIFIFCCK